ncbi:hypothetical protein NX774_04540 [Massilia agilis]|uniref:ATP-binding protein n=1 Tax=Massilia agilis TaxID=1811226 RepID=A0ABT2D9S7_9BURK|nr:hypothetical protein [Massilia agilis]MCS0807186.1 hypothetical protein [Massilia agilis]
MMRRFEILKQLDEDTRNKVRAILGDPEGNAIARLTKLRGKLPKGKAEVLDALLNSHFLGKAVKKSAPFPKNPPFADTLQIRNNVSLPEILEVIDRSATAHYQRLTEVGEALHQIDAYYAENNLTACRDRIIEAINTNGWSHAVLRRAVLIRERLPQDAEDELIEEIVQKANLKAAAVISLVHTYARDQSYLTIKRSVLNLPDRGAINRYSRTLSRLSVQPFAKDGEDLAVYLSEVEKCSLIDAVILAKFNSHLFAIDDYPTISQVAGRLGRLDLFPRLLATYDAEASESEYNFYKQSSTWLEYEPIRQYRILLDNYYDSSREDVGDLPGALASQLRNWVGDTQLHNVVGKQQFTKHQFRELAALELSGTATRSAIFNYWLHQSEGQIGFEKDDLLTLMGVTRDLARTVPIKATRTAAKLATDKLVRLILLLLLGKRSKNELDSFHLRKLLEETALGFHGGSLVALVKSYENTHPYVAEYIYDIATEDFIAKLTRLAPHRADIPEIRASLHEWMAGFTNDEYYLQRARTVRIDHQLNRVRNEIDDHRIYVDPSRFSSWIEDEMMLELNGALTASGSGKKGVSVSCDEAVLLLVMSQCYNAFCSNSVFGIASYIGRRIRHGTFHGHLYSSVINSIEKNSKFSPLFRLPQFSAKWKIWKDGYNRAIEEIIRERLHVHSKSKPLGLLLPEVYGPAKQEILAAAVKSISNNFIDTKSVSGIDQIITDYCWRLAELDLAAIAKYLRAQQSAIKNLQYIEDEVLATVPQQEHKFADAFYRELELHIDRKLASMFGWFKRPSIVAPKASVALLFAATVAEVKDTIPDFNPRADDSRGGEIELVGNVYHLVYDSLAVVVANAAKHGDRTRPLRTHFEVITGKPKKLILEISSAIPPERSPEDVAADIERRKMADFQDANLYQGKSGISKLLLLAHTRDDFWLEQYSVVGDEVKVRLAYALEH